MDRRIIVQYMNSTLGIAYGQITMNDAKVMSAHVKKRTGEYIPPEVIIQAAVNSPVEMMEKYRSGLWNALIKDYNIEVLTLASMEVNGIQGEQIIGYR